MNDIEQFKLIKTDHLAPDNFTSEMKVVSRPDQHQLFDPVKDFTIAFINVYKHLHLAMSSQLVRKDINLGNILWSITDIVNSYNESSSPEQKTGFLFSLLYGNKVMKKNDKRIIHILNEKILVENFNLIEICKLAALAVNAKRENDGFWEAIHDSNINVYEYEDFASVIKDIHLCNEKTFEKILLTLGYKRTS